MTTRARRVGPVGSYPADHPACAHCMFLRHGLQIGYTEPQDVFVQSRSVCFTTALATYLLSSSRNDFRTGTDPHR